MKHIKTYESFLSESRTLTRDDNMYIRGIESIEKRYANDRNISKAMKDVRDKFLPSGKTYKDLTSEELMNFNILIQNCITGKSNMGNTDISAMVAAFPDWAKD